MIKESNKEIGDVLVGTSPIFAIYVGSIPIWIADDVDPSGSAKACFSGGYWDDSLPWVDEEIWLDSVSVNN